MEATELLEGRPSTITIVGGAPTSGSVARAVYIMFKLSDTQDGTDFTFVCIFGCRKSCQMELYMNLHYMSRANEHIDH